MLLHLGNELGLRQVGRWLCPALSDLGGNDVNDVTNFIKRYFFVCVSLPRHHVQEASFSQDLALELEFLLTDKQHRSDGVIGGIL